MMLIVRTDVYIHKYEGYIAYLHEYEDGTQTLEYVKEFDDGTPPCYVRQRVKKKLEKVYKYICSAEDYDEKTKRPKQTESIRKSIRSEDGI